MAENSRLQPSVLLVDGSFSGGLKMPLLNAAFSPGRRPGDFGLYSDKVYVRLLNQTVIELGGGGGGIPPWSSVLAVGANSGATNPIIDAGFQIIYGSGIRIGGNNNSAGGASTTGIAIGGLNGAAGSGAVAVGTQSNAAADETTALGHLAVATALNATAVGSNSQATGTSSLALGYASSAGNNNSIAIGTAGAPAISGIAIGLNASASGDFGVAVGDSALASDLDSVAIGTQANAVQSQSIAIGKNSLATGDVNTMAAGAFSIAEHLNSSCFGFQSRTSQEYQIMLGNRINGLTQQIFGDVVNDGYIWSGAFLRSNLIVHAELTATGAETRNPTTGSVDVLFPTILSSADWGAPSVISTPNRITSRSGFLMMGTTTLILTFADNIGSAAMITAQVFVFNPLLPATTLLGEQTIFLPALVDHVSITIPYSVYTPTTNSTIYVQVDNPTDQIMTIMDTSSLKGTLQN